MKAKGLRCKHYFTQMGEGVGVDFEVTHYEKGNPAYTRVKIHNTTRELSDDEVMAVVGYVKLVVNTGGYRNDPDFFNGSMSPVMSYHEAQDYYKDPLEFLADQRDGNVRTRPIGANIRLLEDPYPFHVSGWY